MPYYSALWGSCENWAETGLVGFTSTLQGSRKRAQNCSHRIVCAGRDLLRSSNPTFPCNEQEHQLDQSWSSYDTGEEHDGRRQKTFLVSRVRGS